MTRRRAVKGESPSQQIFLKVRRSFFRMPAARLDSVPSVDCCSTEENAEVVKDVQKEKESSLSLQRSSEVLGPSPPSTTVLETDLAVRDNLDRKPSFNGNVLFCCCSLEFKLSCWSCNLTVVICLAPLEQTSDQHFWAELETRQKYEKQAPRCFFFFFFKLSRFLVPVGTA